MVRWSIPSPKKKQEKGIAEAIGLILDSQFIVCKENCPKIPLFFTAKQCLSLVNMRIVHKEKAKEEKGITTAAVAVTTATATTTTISSERRRATPKKQWSPPQPEIKENAHGVQT